MRKRALAVVFGLLIAIWATPAFAVLESCDPPGGAVETVDGITITYDSCFQDLNYDLLGNPDITLNVEWAVEPEEASCDFDDFALRSDQANGNGRARGPKGYTPVSPFSPVDGSDVTLDNGSLPATFEFTQLHSAGEVEIGNAHFMLTLDCGVDGMVRLGVNVHVCDNGDTEAQCEEDS